MGKEAVLPFTKLINLLLAKPAMLLLALLHIAPVDAQYPIPNYLAMEILLFIVLGIFFCGCAGRFLRIAPAGRSRPWKWCSQTRWAWVLRT